MKKLTLYTGGHPLTLDDLKHLGNGSLEALSAMAKAFQIGTIPYILYGLDFTLSNGNNTLSWTAGAVVDDAGEICLVDAGNVIKGSTQVFKFEVADSYVSPSPVDYADNNSKNVHLDRKYTFVAANFTVGMITYTDLKPLFALQTSAYSSGNFTASGANWTVASGDSTVKYQRVGKGNQVVVYVNISSSSIDANTAELKISLPASLTAGMGAVGSALVGLVQYPFYIAAGSNELIIYNSGNFSSGAIGQIIASITFTLDN